MPSTTQPTDPLRILIGNCAETLQTLEPASVDLVVTSPPYWGLRDYGIKPVEWPEVTFQPLAAFDAKVTIAAETAVLGLEPTIQAFLAHCVLIFRQIARVLKPTGNLYVNMGDKWVTSGLNGPQGQSGERATRRHSQRALIAKPANFLAPKNLMGQPWLLAYALQADGWILREEIIWHKRNPTPESCQDRCTRAHEQVFHFTRSPTRYYYNRTAIMEPLSGGARPRGPRKVAGWDSGPGSHNVVQFCTPKGAAAQGRPAKGVNPKAALNAPGSRQNSSFSAAISGHPDDRQYSAPYNGHATKDYDSALAQNPSEIKRRIVEAVRAGKITSRNKRSVWSLVNEPFKGSHFATFPTALIRPIIRAACPLGGTVLDPFGGSGTTAKVALEEGRQAILCEMNAEYIPLITERCGGGSMQQMMQL